MPYKSCAIKDSIATPGVSGDTISTPRNIGATNGTFRTPEVTGDTPIHTSLNMRRWW